LIESWTGLLVTSIVLITGKVADIMFSLDFCFDHHPLVLSISNNVDVKRTPSFRFFKMWFQNLDLFSLVKESWVGPASGCPMLVLQRKRQRLKVVLKAWNNNNFGNVHSAVTGNQKKLTDIHNLIASSSNFVISSLLAQDKIVMDDLNMALDCQAIFWKEKAKMNWFMVGDRNTTFFHSVVKKKKA